MDVSFRGYTTEPVTGGRRSPHSARRAWRCAVPVACWEPFAKMRKFPQGVEL